MFDTPKAWNRLDALWYARNTVRTHTMSHACGIDTGAYTVGMHSDGLVRLTLLAQRHKNKLDMETTHIDFTKVARYLCLHDLGEVVIGDIPSPAKRFLGIHKTLPLLEEQVIRFMLELELPEINEDERILAKQLDVLELYLQVMSIHDTFDALSSQAMNCVAFAEHLYPFLDKITGLVEEVIFSAPATFFTQDAGIHNTSEAIILETLGHAAAEIDAHEPLIDLPTVIMTTGKAVSNL